jgi:hypothetical protein
MWCLTAQAFIVIVLACVATYVLLSWGGSAAARYGEDPFTRDQRADVVLLRPGGRFVSPSEYVYCSADGYFHHVDSRERDYVVSDRDTCAYWLKPRP